ncbi:iron permease [Cyathus striatus]|nr:iron permease [Cyathus striatus]
MSTETLGDQTKPKRGIKFWGVFIAITVAAFTSALDLTAVSTALPVIAHDLDGSQFIWVPAAYALSSTAFLPTSGGLAQVFGRRSVMLVGLFLFALGSAMCGAAPSMNFLIASRTIQGLGAGAITSLTQIILSDMTSLQERGTFNAFIALAWAVASFTGPVIGGGLASRGAWRWLFYLNLFTSAFSAFLVVIFLRLKTPEGTIKEKLGKMDWVGNILIIASSSACIIALTWGGVVYPWSSARVLVPLVLGIVGLILTFMYEACSLSILSYVPFALMSTRTGLSGYLQTFLTAIVLVCSVYYLPVYFQACKGASPVGSGVDIFGLGFVLTPCWAVMMVGLGLLSMLDADTVKGASIGYEAVVAIGLGIMTTATYFPNAHALAFFTFARSFGQVWGLTIGASALQNFLSNNLPADFQKSFPEGTPVAYAAIPVISSLPPATAAAVRVAFAGGLSRIWEILIGISGLGLLVSFGMKHLPLHNSVDEKWGVEKGPEGDAEKPLQNLSHNDNQPLRSTLTLD